jgi:hypothetical protein
MDVKLNLLIYTLFICFIAYLLAYIIVVIIALLFKFCLHFQKDTEPIILEYFEHGDTAEAALSLDEIGWGTKRYLVSKLICN